LANYLASYEATLGGGFLVPYGIAPKFGVLIGGLLAMILGAADKYLLFEHSKAGFDRSVIRIAQIKDIPFSCDFYFY